MEHIVANATTIRSDKCAAPYRAILDAKEVGKQLNFCERVKRGISVDHVVYEAMDFYLSTRLSVCKYIDPYSVSSIIFPKDLDACLVFPAPLPEFALPCVYNCFKFLSIVFSTSH